MAHPVDVYVEPTPNPNSYKFTLDRTVSEQGSRSYARADQAQDDPLARRLFEIDGVRSLFFLNNFITVTRDPGRAWDDIAPKVVAAIQDHYAS